ncbi:uncharacterized protein At5g39865 [Cannabis sativa]|uniref:Glutaredoxin domain-containing protein n=1 Tax=Cannabis sativa TaxID=3483 RepID=A0A7J6G3N0_CANSA|nr:uncharacterized protein At5g39865 [Cannabis sativa]KAF4376669.1 hypothetical protein F8388_025540 [Cannabis sativa]
MGCASSKQKRCRNCQGPYSPVPRSYSMHVHHPPEKNGDSYHLVALTSSTLGSIKLETPFQNDTVHNHDDDETDYLKSKDFSVGLVEAKTWSNMINEKIPKVLPKTPIRTPPGEPETINAWELMEGLEDISPFRSPIHVRSFSFDIVRDPIPIPTSPFDRPKSRFQENNNDSSSPKPMWLHLSDKEDLNSDSGVTEFDPEIISSFRKSLEDKPKEKLILYFTSLRGVRKTYEDCCNVRVILKSLCVKVDERDVSMHSGFKDELKELLKDGFHGGGLPRVFMGNKYIGGADEIRRLNEDGQLEKLLECCEKVDDDCGDGGGACEACGDVRFVPCETCSGSCKIYYEAEKEEEETEEGEEEHEHEEEEDYGFQRCPDCNENGLIRCPICCN